MVPSSPVGYTPSSCGNGSAIASILKNDIRNELQLNQGLIFRLSRAIGAAGNTGTPKMAETTIRQGRQKTGASRQRSGIHQQIPPKKGPAAFPRPQRRKRPGPSV
jgi:hypothetical protein